LSRRSFRAKAEACGRAAAKPIRQTPTLRRVPAGPEHRRRASVRLSLLTVRRPGHACLSEPACRALLGAGRSARSQATAGGVALLFPPCPPERPASGLGVTLLACLGEASARRRALLASPELPAKAGSPSSAGCSPPSAPRTLAASRRLRLLRISFRARASSLSVPHVFRHEAGCAPDTP
jgi:hypothetical protein